MCGWYQIDRPADELQSHISDQSPLQQTGFEQDLESIADTNHKTAGGGKLLNSLNDWGESGYGSATQIIAIGKAAGNEYSVNTFEVPGFVPDFGDVLLHIRRQRIDGVVVTIGTGECNDSEFHPGQAKMFRNICILSLSWTRFSGKFDAQNKMVFKHYVHCLNVICRQNTLNTITLFAGVLEQLGEVSLKVVAS